MDTVAAVVPSDCLKSAPSSGRLSKLKYLAKIVSLGIKFKSQLLSHIPSKPVFKRLASFKSCCKWRVVHMAKKKGFRAMIMFD